MSNDSDLGEQEVAYLLEVIELARQGATARLVDEVTAGISINLTNGAGDTLLIVASYHGHADTVEMLLRRGADHRRLNRRGQTALGSAVFRQDVGIVRQLLAAGADPDLGTPSAREVAKFFGLDSMDSILARYPSPSTRKRSTGGGEQNAGLTRSTRDAAKPMRG